MKKLMFVLIIVVLAAGTVSAQSWCWCNRCIFSGVVSQSISVSGTLQLQNGSIAVASGSNVYLVPVLTQYIGFIDGLREGAQVSMNGFASGNIISPTEVTISGRTYVFTQNIQQGVARGHHGGWGQHRFW